MIRLILLSLVLSYLSAVEQGQIVRFSDLNRETLQEGVQFIFTDPMTSETVTAEITKILPAGGPIDFTFKPLSTAPHSIDPGPSPSPDVAGVSPRSNGTDMPNPGAPPSLRQALGTGLAAGGFHAVVGTVYQGLIMTNKRTRDLQRSFNERARAEGQQYRAQTDLARAIDFNQTLGHVITARLLSPNIPVNLAALHSAKAMLPVGISTGDARFDGRALPISRRLHSIPSSNVLNRNVKEFGFSALRAGGRRVPGRRRNHGRSDVDSGAAGGRSAGGPGSVDRDSTLGLRIVFRIKHDHWRGAESVPADPSGRNLFDLPYERRSDLIAYEWL